MKNPLSHARSQRAIALLFLALVLAGAVAGLVRSLQATNAAPRISRPAVTERAPHGRLTAPTTGQQR